MSISLQAVKAARAALDAHQEVRRYELFGDHHATVMLLADLIDYADSNAIDLDAALEEARDVAADGRA